MNADPNVMRYYAQSLTRGESEARVSAYQPGWSSGFGRWAVEIPGVAPFAGMLGLSRVTFIASFTPCIEIGWRLASPFWGCGYATEGAQAALDFGFQNVGLETVFAFTVLANGASRRVMEKLNMSYTGEFAHPLFAADHPLRTHVLYRAAPGDLVQ